MSEDQSKLAAHKYVYKRVYSTVAGYFDENGHLHALDALEALVPVRQELIARHPEAIVDVLGAAAMRDVSRRASEMVALRDSARTLSPEDFL
jgi:hypothetical protein